MAESGVKAFYCISITVRVSNERLTFWEYIKRDRHLQFARPTLSFCIFTLYTKFKFPRHDDLKALHSNSNIQCCQNTRKNSENRNVLAVRRTRQRYDTKVSKLNSPAVYMPEQLYHKGHYLFKLVQERQLCTKFSS